MHSLNAKESLGVLIRESCDWLRCRHRQRTLQCHWLIRQWQVRVQRRKTNHQHKSMHSLLFLQRGVRRSYRREPVQRNCAALHTAHLRSPRAHTATTGAHTGGGAPQYGEW